MLGGPMERCLEVFVRRTHKTRIVAQETRDDRHISVSDGLEHRGCAIHACPRRKSLIVNLRSARNGDRQSVRLQLNLQLVSRGRSSWLVPFTTGALDTPNQLTEVILKSA